VTKREAVRQAKAVERGELLLIRAIRTLQAAGMTDDQIREHLARLLPFLARMDAVRAGTADD